MRGSLSLFLALAVALPLSGCIGAPEDEIAEDDPGLPSAADAVTAADEALRLNGTTAVLYGVMGVESVSAGAYSLDGLLGNESGLGMTDTVIGDGRTPAWLAFWKDEAGAATITVGGHTPVLVPAPGGDVYPFGRGILNDMASRVPIGKNWIDSTRALRIAMHDDYDMSQMMDQFDVEIVMILQRHANQAAPVWTVIVTPLQSDERRIVVVDAIDGYVRDDYYPQDVHADNHHDLAADPTAPATTTLSLDGGVGIIFLEFEPAPAGTYASPFALRAEVEHPDGSVDVIDTSRWPREVAFPIYGAPAGTYTVRAWPVLDTGPLEIPAADQIHTHWCIAGVLPDPTGQSRAPCDRYYEYM